MLIIQPVTLIDMVSSDAIKCFKKEGILWSIESKQAASR